MNVAMSFFWRGGSVVVQRPYPDVDESELQANAEGAKSTDEAHVQTCSPSMEL